MNKPTNSITRYCAYNEGMSDPPMFDESATGDWVCFWDHTSEVETLERQIKQLREALQRLTKNFPTDSELDEAGWGGSEINDACDAYDAACAALSAERKTTS